MDQDQVNAAFMADFSGETAYASAAPLDMEVSAEAFAGPIIDRITNRARAIKDYVTLEMVLMGAKLAFDFAIAQIPLTISPELKAQLWSLCESGIRALYA